MKIKKNSDLSENPISCSYPQNPSKRCFLSSACSHSCLPRPVYLLDVLARIHIHMLWRDRSGDATPISHHHITVLTHHLHHCVSAAVILFFLVRIVII